MDDTKEKDVKYFNRIKVVLAEQRRTNKWLAEQVGRDPVTVSKWCTNTSQPSMDTLLEIANALEMNIQDLLLPTNQKK
jgi:DNA-binding Xre family transcriptional regulator